MMTRYQPQDRYFREAKRKGLPSRAAFKLVEIDQKYRLFQKGGVVLDLGAAPGGWSQVALQAVGPTGRVIAVDLEKCRLPARANFRFIPGDLRDPVIQERLQSQAGGRADTLLSDLSPRTSGVKFRDQMESQALASEALALCPLLLRPGGHFVAKIFPGEGLAAFKKELAAQFREVHQFIPEATRRTSKEIYLIAKGYKGK